MLRAGWTFLRVGSPIRDRPHSPKYACRGSGGQDEGWRENRYGAKKKMRRWRGRKEREKDLV